MVLTYVEGPDGKKHLTMPDEMKAGIIQFIRETAAKPAKEIAAVLQEGHDELCAALEGVSDAQARFKPGPEDWSILELMNHVVTVKRMMTTLGQTLAQGTLPPGLEDPVWREESRQDGVTLASFSNLAEARAEADKAHEALLAFVATFTPETNTSVEFPHFFFGSMNCREWAVFQRIHDADHAPGIGKIKASAGFPTA